MKWGSLLRFCSVILLCFSSFLCAKFKLGIEYLPDQLVTQLQQKCVGLITNQTGVDQHGRRTVSVLKSHGIDVQVLFAPEHGYNGNVGAGKHVDDNVDDIYGITIKSLYNKASPGNVISQDMFENVDVIVFDMQDVGMRHYTYISTLFRVMQALQRNDIQLVVCDRPNVLGSLMQGPLVDDELISFISIASIPLRHGMTIGELAYYFNQHYFENKVNIHVVTMKDYKRNKRALSYLLAPLSPNITSVQSCYGYTFLGLLGEVAPFDVGVGGEKPFRVITLPRSLSSHKEFWEKLHVLLKNHNVYSRTHEYFNMRKKQWFSGLEVAINDIQKVASFKLFVEIVLLAKQYVQTLRFSPTFDKAVGSKKVRELLKQSTSFIECDHLFKTIRDDLYLFIKRAEHSLIYEPIPSLNCW